MSASVEGKFRKHMIENIHRGETMKKSTKFIAILALVLSIVINYGCPGIFGYNIVGTWSVRATFGVDDTENYIISFAGDRKTGTVTWTAFGYSLTGTYAIDGKNIDFEVSSSDELQTFTGTFSNNKEMSGTGVWLVYGDAASVLSNTMRRQARAVAKSDSFAFNWVGTRN